MGDRMSLGQKIIVTMGAFVITFMTICMIFRQDISFLLVSKKIEREYGTIEANSYFIEDYFEYTDNYEFAEVHSKKEIIDSIYYLINSGVSSAKRYCAKDYKNCYSDIDDISNDANLLSVLNNYVHPFNSFDSIIFNFDENVIEIEIKHTYTKEDIDVLNSRVDAFISQNITNNMSTRDKIKVIHDYIINNTKYDSTNKTGASDIPSSTAYGVLKDNIGICSGYADVMSLFLDKLNIKNYRISSDSHVWNLVYIEGAWKHLDVTWDDPVTSDGSDMLSDKYFLIDNNTLLNNSSNEHIYNKEIYIEAQ